MNNRKFARLSAAQKRKKLAYVLQYNESDADLRHRSCARQYRLLTERKSTMCLRRTQPNYQIPMPAPLPETEADLLRRAFGLIQRRIGEYLAGSYPDARWVWECPNPQARIAEGDPLYIRLNHAGGYRRAEVLITQLQFKGLRYDAISEPVSPPPEEPPEEPGETDYSYLAYEWVAAHAMELDARANEAAARGETEFIIPADELPDPASWQAVCEELMRNGFNEAVVTETGITTKIEVKGN
jgi:hypothetical protein